MAIYTRFGLAGYGERRAGSFADKAAIVTEILRPSGDVAADGWLNELDSATNIYQSIDEAIISDLDYVKSPGLTGSFKVRLYEGSTQIVEWTEASPSTTFTTVAQLLTGPQFAAITDWDNLFIELDDGAGDIYRFGVGNPSADVDQPVYVRYRYKKEVPEALGQVRVTFKAPNNVSNGFGTVRCSIGIQKPSYTQPYETAATPVELTFDTGTSGFAEMVAGATKTSDWVDLVISPNIGTVFSTTLTAEESGWPGYGIRCVVTVNGTAIPVVITMDVIPGVDVADMLRYSDGNPTITYYSNHHSSTAATAAEVGSITGPYGSGRVEAIVLIETR